MTILTWKRARPDRPALREQVIGNAIVVHLSGRISDEAVELALLVARDPHHDLVVVDLPPGSPVGLWSEVADRLPRRRRGVRLVVGGRTRETTTLAGQWLAERLGRSVVAPDGAVHPGVGGSLFVHSGRGTGWVRFQPGKPPRWEAKRFPQPQWDSEVFAEDWPTSARGIAEPIPGGLWIRPLGHEAKQGRHRRRLVETVPCQNHLITVVVGCPGFPPLSLDDITRLWVRLRQPVRDRVRFVQFGPVAAPPALPLGQALADCLGERVACYSGLPVGTGGEPDVYTVDDEGGLGWRTPVRELGYVPGSDGAAQPPVLLSHHSPLPGMTQVAPAVYWYAPDAVVEVVQSGLWVRPQAEGPNARAVRSTPVNRAVQNLMFDEEPGSERMRLLAEDVLARLHPATRNATRVLPAHAVLGRDHIKLNGPALAELDPAPAVLMLPGPVPAGPAPVGPAPVPDAATLAATGPEPTPDAATPAAADPEPVPVPVPDENAPNEGVLDEDAPDDGVDGQPGDAVPVELPPVPELGPGAPAGFRLESATPPPAAEPTEVRVATSPDRPQRTKPAVRPQETDEPEAVFQPTPVTAASALLPARGIDEERGWLRRTLGPEYGTQANSVARVLSMHPGFQGPQKSSSPDAATDALTDAVAVRLHLAAHGAAIDLALRTATVGPHVPFGRCVVSGLGKLPSHRGPTVFRAEPTPQQLRLYRERNLVTEWGFVHALTAPCARQTGSTDVLIWSMTARRTRLLESDECRTEDRVLFLPGTSFKVLRVRPPTATARGQILLRELAAGEIGADGRVEAGPVPLDELSTSSLEGQLEQWTATEPPPRVPEAATDRFGALPGLIVRRGGDR